MSSDKIKLRVLGISYSPLRSGAFAMLLAQDDGPYRIPIVIGATEAQAIAIEMERIVTPRPITHDLFCSFAHAFGVELTEVFIYKFEDGIFSSELVFTDGLREVRLDSRTSDAVAIALRMNAPIYTTEEIMLQTGTRFKNDDDKASADAELAQAAGSPSAETSPEKMSIEELEALLQKYIENEDYEQASNINKIIKRRKDEGY